MKSVNKVYRLSCGPLISLLEVERKTGKPVRFDHNSCRIAASQNDVMNRFASLMLVIAGTINGSQASERTSVDDMKTVGDIQGLYEIREVARTFVAAHNARRHTNWEALEPDLRVLVPRCLVPMKARWKKGSEKTQRPVALVTCKKPTPASADTRPWAVEVPAMIPQGDGRH